MLGQVKSSPKPETEMGIHRQAAKLRAGPRRYAQQFVYVRYRLSGSRERLQEMELVVVSCDAAAVRLKAEARVQALGYPVIRRLLDADADRGASALPRQPFRRIDERRADALALVLVDDVQVGDFRYSLLAEWTVRDTARSVTYPTTSPASLATNTARSPRRCWA